MTKIEERFEAPNRSDPDYRDTGPRHGEWHRSWVGGKWDEIGRLQLDFLLAQGLKNTDVFLDVGCGSLRAGRHLVGYLEPGRYYGIDINPDVITAGYELELDEHLRPRLPLSNLRASDRFDADFGVKFDVAIAQSLFTHLPLNHIRLCMFRVAKVMQPGGRLYATFFEQPRSFPVDGVVGRNRRSRHGERNPYWYYRTDMRWLARFGEWEFSYIGRWDHPRDQRMVVFTKI